MLKVLFEKVLLSTRAFIILPVVFSMLSALVLFIVATADVISMLSQLWGNLMGYHPLPDLHALVVGEIVGAVDIYLIAIVLVIFSFGVYELFVTEIENSSTKVPAILSISSLDELKDKLAKVIIMVLVVSYFRRVFYIQYTGPLEMMYFALSIAALSIGVYLLHKDAKHKRK